ncbi:hypothetical protein BZL54_23080 [Burkholderia ubonensis subsp. mesacidophila]|uniref:Uncharacterized protein n=2 Tax=Burkholderia ubonensis TaxID=101571 RepID=A0A2A4F9J1_9BURK|nr:hypothetical protein BZL54_23080 [Burkholderia ubonensis subsp. mesacidophila]
MVAMRAKAKTPVAFFHIVSKEGVDMGWIGFCEAIGEAMIPALLHPDGVEGAEKRALNDPPAVIGIYNGESYVPHAWIRKVLKGERDLFVIDAMKVAAENGFRQSRGEPPEEAPRTAESQPHENDDETNRDHGSHDGERGGIIQRLRRWRILGRR